MAPAVAREMGKGVSEAEALTEQLKHFCAVMRGEVAPLITGMDGVRTLAVTQAVIESRLSGRFVWVGEG